MRRADVIWTVIEWEWLGASFLQKVGLLQQKPIIGNNVFLAQEYPQMGRLRRLSYRVLMSPTVYLTAHSQLALDVLRSQFPGHEFHFTPFGIPTQTLPVIPPRAARAPGPIRIYSIGDDRCRDWDAILQAFGNDPRFAIRLVCRRLDASLVDRFSNLELPKEPSLDQQRANYQWADFVVVAMRENIYSGITVMCEAAASGVPIIASRTGGAESYFTGEDVLYVAPGAIAELREAALETPADVRHRLALSAQRTFLEKGYSADDMVKRYVQLSRELLMNKGATRRPFQGKPPVEAPLSQRPAEHS